MTEETIPTQPTAPETQPEPATEPVAAASITDAAPEAVAAPAVSEPTPAEAPAAEPEESFGDLLHDFEQSHSHRKQAPDGAKQLEGVVVSLTAEQVFLDVGYKIEGVLPRTAFKNNAEDVNVGDRFPVSITGRNEEGYYELSLFKVAQPKDWSALEAAFEAKTAVVGTVTEVRKGGFSVDIGVRAFMPASRSGTHDAAEMDKLVGTEINCRITKLDVSDEDVVVDRRVVLEEQAKATLEARWETLQVGETLDGTVRSLVPYGAFVDLGGIDGLLHVSDISWGRVNKPEDVLSVGQQIKVRLLKLDQDKKKISLGLKQLEPAPWESVPERFKEGQRITGTVTRLADFGAFVEIEPGVEGLIHISEMAWNKKVRHPEDVVKVGERVDAVILSIKPEEQRIALGLKQTLADPWLEAEKNFPAGSQVEGTVTKLMNFGAFVEIAPGVEGLVHISEIVDDRRLNHPSDALRTGERVRALVLAVDAEKRQYKLSIKQLLPTDIDELIAESKVGDKVSGRVIAINGAQATVELGEGIVATCSTCGAAAAPSAQSAKTWAPAATGAVDLSALSSMLKNRWKGNTAAPQAAPEPLAPGQVRSFKIVKLDPETKKIEVELI
ncbi:MAG: S1 RNA-binding domain-containing protein [Terracidiphilus sp.]|nr:S1 RNA-binding domain-containing protein [Terracidiphilus sp.]